MDLEPNTKALFAAIISPGNLSVVEITANPGRIRKMLEERGIPVAETPPFIECLWELIIAGFVYIGITASSADPTAHATRKGQLLWHSPSTTPDDPGGFMRAILAQSSNTSDATKLYLEESLKAFNAQCYISSAMMLGVAAESGILETAHELLRVFPASPSAPTSTKLAQLLTQRLRYEQKLDAFKEAIEAQKQQLPAELGQPSGPGFEIIYNLIRITRNQTGHPSGEVVNERHARRYLNLYEGAHQWVHKLKAHLTAQP